MKLEPKKEKRITVRLSERDHCYLEAVALMAGMTTSRYVRTLIDSSINAAKMSEAKGMIDLENIKAVLKH